MQELTDTINQFRENGEMMMMVMMVMKTNDYNENQWLKNHHPYYPSSILSQIH